MLSVTVAEKEDRMVETHTMPIPATARKFPMKALLTARPRKPINEQPRVVRVVAKAPWNRYVSRYFLKELGDGTYDSESSRAT